MFHFTWIPYPQLTLNQLYALLYLRARVFVVDQMCPYLDPDGLDFEAIHLLGTKGDELQAYMRLFPPGSPDKKIVFGRVVTAPKMRGTGLGKRLLQEMVTYCQSHYPHSAIECSAQLYLQRFYESFGFKTVGEPYAEDNIPHIKMILDRFGSQ